MATDIASDAKRAHNKVPTRLVAPLDKFDVPNHLLNTSKSSVCQNHRSEMILMSLSSQ
jgi:hypothetical protein